MATIEQFLDGEGASEKFAEASDLESIESKNDPENEPYKSKYKAREIWVGLRDKLLSYHENYPEKEDWLLMLAFIEMKLGVNYVETEELASGEQHLNTAAERLNPYRLDKRGICVLQIIMNQLGILWTSRRNSQKSLTFLKEAESLYKEYKHEVGNAPLMPQELFAKHGDSEEEEADMTSKRRSLFEDTYTHTLYYLAQVYPKLGDTDTSASYCHVTLQRQLDSMKYDPFDWSLNCATLSQYYITNNDYKVARHCMASSSFIFSELGDIGPTKMPQPAEEESQADVDNRERFPRARADIARCWAKYGLALLESSKEALFKEMEEMDNDHNTDKKHEQKDESDLKDDAKKAAALENGEKKDTDKDILLFNIEVTSYEDQVTCELVLTFDQAREVFLVTQKYLNLAKEFYIMDGYCSDHVEVVQDLSRLFKVLAFFEPNLDRQCKMHKRRIDMLSELLKELNPQFYLLLCRQIMYEMAEIYSGMLDIKLAIMEEEGGTPSAHAVKKINMLAEQSIAKYVEYINSLKDSSKQLPSRFSDDDERPALVAHFCMGRLYSKIIHPDIRKRLAYMNMSFASYKFLVDYGKTNPEALPKIRSEYEICEEMVTLLPHKMARMRSQNEY